MLPFDNLNAGSEDEWFAIGLHDELLNQLAKIRDLSTIARTSVLRYADTDMAISEIAAELNVESIMEGTVRYAGGSVRVTTQLIDAATGAHLWSETYTRPFEDIFAIETDIATQIAAALEAEFSPEEQQRIANQSTSQSPRRLRFMSGPKHYGSPLAPSLKSSPSVQADLKRARLHLTLSLHRPMWLLAGVYARQAWVDTGTPGDWRDRGLELEKLAVEHAPTRTDSGSEPGLCPLGAWIPSYAEPAWPGGTPSP